MSKLKSIIAFWNKRLILCAIPEDASNNGLQVEGVTDIKKIVFGVDACLALFEKAAEKDADLIFVHHGMSWGGGFKKLVGNTP
mgnify:FL=1